MSFILDSDLNPGDILMCKSQGHAVQKVISFGESIPTGRAYRNYGPCCHCLQGGAGELADKDYRGHRVGTCRSRSNRPGDRLPPPNQQSE